MANVSVYCTCKSIRGANAKWSVRSVICGRETKIFIPNQFIASAQNHGPLKEPLIWPSKVSASQSSLFWQTRRLRAFCAHLHRIRASQTLSKAPHNHASHSPSLSLYEKMWRSRKSLCSLRKAHRLSSSSRLAPADAEENEAVPVSRVLKLPNREEEYGVMG